MENAGSDHPVDIKAFMSAVKASDQIEKQGKGRENRVGYHISLKDIATDLYSISNRSIYFDCASGMPLQFRIFRLILSI